MRSDGQEEEAAAPATTLRARRRPWKARRAALRGLRRPGGRGAGGANLERRERKEEARRLREAERRRARRAASFRRTFTSIGIAAAAVAAITLFRSFGGPNDIPANAVRAAEEAGCTEVDQPASSAPSGQHLQPGQDPGYTDTPATSGFHDPSPLPDEPKVYDTQPPETNAVHSLEHGAVFVYYLPEADGGISQELVDRLAQIAEGSNATFLAPYPDTHRGDRTHAHRVEPTAILSGGGPTHAGGGRDHRQRIRDGVRVHRQRAGEQQRALLRLS